MYALPQFARKRLPAAIALALSLLSLTPARPALAQGTLSASGSATIDGSYFNGNTGSQTGTLTQAASSAAFNQSFSAPGSPSSGGATPTQAYAGGQATWDGVSGFAGSLSAQGPYNFSSARQSASLSLIYTDTLVNTTATAQDAVLNFEVSPVQMGFGIGSADGSTGALASFAATISTGGATPVWSSSFAITGNAGIGLTSNASGTDLGLQGAFNAAAINGPYNLNIGISSNAFTERLDLGSLAAGQSLTVSYEVDLTSTISDIYGGTASASFGDPVSLSAATPGGTPVASLGFAAPVPEPESCALMAAGLGLLAASAARRARRG